MKHTCCSCKFLATIIDSGGRSIELCTFDQSDNYLQEVGICSEDCELEDFAEEIWQRENGKEAQQE